MRPRWTTLFVALCAFLPACTKEVREKKRPEPPPESDAAPEEPEVTGTHVMVAPGTALYRDAVLSKLAFKTRIDQPTIFRLAEPIDSKGGAGAVTKLATLDGEVAACYPPVIGTEAVDLVVYAPRSALLAVSTEVLESALPGGLRGRLAPGAVVSDGRAESAYLSIPVPAEIAGVPAFNPLPPPSGESHLFTRESVAAVPKSFGKVESMLRGRGKAPISQRRFAHGRVVGDEFEISEGCATVILPEKPTEAMAALLGVLGAGGFRREVESGSPVYWADGAKAGVTRDGARVAVVGKPKPAGKKCARFGGERESGPVGLLTALDSLEDDGKPKSETFVLCFDESSFASR